MGSAVLVRGPLPVPSWLRVRLDSCGSPVPLVFFDVARLGTGPEGIGLVLLGLGFARQRGVNHGVLTLWLAGPCDRGNLCRQRPAERAVRLGTGRPRHRADATHRRIFAPSMRRPDAFLRRHGSSCARRPRASGRRHARESPAGPADARRSRIWTKRWWLRSAHHVVSGMFGRRCARTPADLPARSSR
jgi:hypothetical protein